MSRPVTLFTGQWADLPLAELAAKCGEWGFDGLELACRGDQFDVAEARSSPSSGPNIFHAHIKDSVRHLDGRSSILGGHLDFGQPGRGWDFVSPGHGDVDFESMIRALNQWEDSGIDRDWGAPDALAFVRRTDFAPSSVAFDAAFAKER